MRISVHFHFNGNVKPSATTGVVGQVTDLILPSIGDTVRHCDSGGVMFTGRVTDRLYQYELTDGHNVDGSITVVLWMDRLQLQ